MDNNSTALFPKINYYAFCLKINGKIGRIPPVLFQGTEPPLLWILAHFSYVNYMTTPMKY